MDDPLFHVVLHRPEIPNNTGNIGRTAAATGCRLHIVHPIGFDMSEKARRRAGLDYWEQVDCREHAAWESFLETERPARLWLLTTRAERPVPSFENGGPVPPRAQSSMVRGETGPQSWAATGRLTRSSG